MNPNRFRLCLGMLAILIAANVAWRVYAGWGLITVHADDAQIGTVLRSIEKQAGVQLRTNLSPDKTVTMHVTKVPLLHALEVLAANTDTSWNVSYFTAADRASIDAALASFARDPEPEGWKRFSSFGRGMRGGMGGGPEQGISDPREKTSKGKTPTKTITLPRITRP